VSTQILELHRLIYQDLREDGFCSDQGVRDHIQMVESRFGRCVTTAEQNAALSLAHHESELRA
jgi:hypothetical protein